MKKLFIFLLTLVVIVVAFVAFLLTPVGSNLLKEVLQSQINKYVPGVEVSYLDYGINNFKVILKKGNNELNVYGKMYPLKAVFDGKADDLSEISEYYRGKMKVSGKIYKENEEFVLNGKAFFAKSDMDFKLKLGKNYVDLHARGNNFDLKELMYMIKVDIPYVEGRSDIIINKSADSDFKIRFRSTGDYNGKIKTPFNALTKIIMKHRNDLEFESTVNTKITNINFKGKVLPQKVQYSFVTGKFDLKYLRPVIMYPFNITTKLEGSYDSSNDILKFQGDGFEGFKDKALVITFKLNDDKFFKYVNLPKLFDGEISGSIKISDGIGVFDMVNNNSAFVPNEFTQKIEKLTGVNLVNQHISKIFLKGYFNDKGMIYDMLCTNKKLFLSIKKGKFIYPNLYEMVLFLRNGNYVYKVLINNKEFKIIDKLLFKESNNKVLVF